MSRQRIGKRVVAKYVLLQLPALCCLLLLLLALQHWLALPGWAVWTTVALWVAKDALLFPLVWRAYDPAVPSTAADLLGALGTAQERLAPTGYIRVRGELWRARLAAGERAVEVGERVRVREMDNLTLWVEWEEPRQL